MTSEIIVSVVVPVYNEEKYIEKCIASLLLQDYPIEKMEWIFVDGCSKDKTVEILTSFQNQYPKLIKIFNNLQKIVPHAMNIGIEEFSFWGRCKGHIYDLFAEPGKEYMKSKLNVIGI